MSDILVNENETGVVLMVSVDKISLNPYQPRKTFDPISISELSQSIKEYGVIQPITIRKNFIGGYELVSGERRLRATKQAGLEKIPCILIDVSENDSAIIALLENLQRADLTFLEEADALSHLVDEHNYTQEQLAKKLGKSQSAIANKLRVLRLPEEVKKILNENNLTERHARALLKLPSAKLQLKVVKTVAENELTVTATERLVQKEINDLEKKEPVPKIKTPMQIRMLINSINKALDTVKKSGLNVESVKNENDTYVEYLIKIPIEH